MAGKRTRIGKQAKEALKYLSKKVEKRTRIGKQAKEALKYLSKKVEKRKDGLPRNPSNPRKKL